MGILAPVPPRFDVAAPREHQPVHATQDLEPEDLCALTVEAAAMAKVPLAGTNYIPGVTEQGTLTEIKSMMEKYLADTGQYPGT